MDLSKIYNPDHCDKGQTELDSHADTCVAGANTVPLWFTEHHALVSPFIGEYKPLKDIPIASVATAWDNPVDGSTVILVVNEALYFGDRMPYSLLCPNQLRHNGVSVNDVPKFFNSTSSHSICFQILKDKLYFINLCLLHLFCLFLAVVFTILYVCSMHCIPA